MSRPTKSPTTSDPHSSAHALSGLVRSDLRRRVRRRLAQGISWATIAIVAAACTQAPDVGTVAPQDVISGTLTAPAGHDVQGTEVHLCPVSGAACLMDVITTAGTTAEYRFEDLAEAAYRIVAIKAVTDTAFLTGCYGIATDIACQPDEVTPPNDDADIDLTLVEVPAPPAPPAGVPPAE